jgi:hypothetical protein
MLSVTVYYDCALMGTAEQPLAEPGKHEADQSEPETAIRDIQVPIAPVPRMRQIWDVISEDPPREVWRRLRYFLDEQYTVDHIVRAQGVDIDRYRRDVQKQAAQLAYCIRQAEEYFCASTQVDIPTRPVLLYYGAVSLSRAIALLRQSGDYSFDRLRQSGRHHHRGLDLDRGAVPSPARAPGPIEFLRALRCKCHLHEQTQEPWGNFPLFYRSLIPASVHLESAIRTYVPQTQPLGRELCQKSGLGGIQ